MKPLYFFHFCFIFIAITATAQVKDINGKTYTTVKIGTQEWMSENLDVATFRNGDSIPQAKSGSEWQLAGQDRRPVWCYYNNDPVMGKLYGKLYNWYAINDPRGLAPEGWHVPGDKEWTVLIDYLGGDSVAGRKMKNITGWNDTYGPKGPYDREAKLASGNGTNESGFVALPAGVRNYGTFYGLGVWCYFWSSSEYGYDNLQNDARFAYYRYMDNGYPTYIFRANIRKWEGYSCRCVKD
jgi:uncharacterized protein (TIGR02145 family)